MPAPDAGWPTPRLSDAQMLVQPKGFPHLPTDAVPF